LPPAIMTGRDPSLGPVGGGSRGWGRVDRGPTLLLFHEEIIRRRSGGFIIARLPNTRDVPDDCDRWLQEPARYRRPLVTTCQECAGNNILGSRTGRQPARHRPRTRTRRTVSPCPHCPTRSDENDRNRGHGPQQGVRLECLMRRRGLGRPAIEPGIPPCILNGETNPRPSPLGLGDVSRLEKERTLS